MKKLARLTITLAALVGTSSIALADNDDRVIGRGTGDQHDRVDDRFDRSDDQFDDRYDRGDDDRAYYDDDADADQFRQDNDGNYWRGNRRFIRAEQQSRWLDLGTASGGTTQIRVGKDLGRFTSLKLDVSGYMRIQRVEVRFADGRSQVVRTRSLSTGARSPMVIDIAGVSRRIVGITVVAGRYSRGQVTVSGLEAARHYWRRYVR